MTWYTGNPTFDTVLTVGLAFALFTIVAAPFANSPYGRFASEQWGGINLNPKLGWWLMEIPATVVFLWFFLANAASWNITALVLAAFWVLHYGNRGWFFPLSIRVARDRRSTFSLVVMALGMFVTGIHGYLNATWFTRFGEHLTADWLTDPRFIVGVIIYLAGFLLIVHSEAVVRALRDPAKQGAGPGSGQESGQRDYKIPYGGGYRFVSSPQYLGELIAWAGFSIFTWGLPGVMIFLISAGNLVPRALATHRWYKEKFPDYPANRKALIPYVV